MSSSFAQPRRFDLPDEQADFDSIFEHENTRRCQTQFVLQTIFSHDGM